MQKKRIYLNSKTYKTLKTFKTLFSRLIIVSNGLIKHKNLIEFYQYRINKKVLIKLINESVFKNFESIVNSNIFFVKVNPKPKTLIKKNNLEQKGFTFFNNILVVKLNNKFYSSKIFLKPSNFLTYQENLLLLFQIKIVQVKNILKT